MPFHVAEPSEEAPLAGGVIHDALGMTQDLQNQADWLAGEGYLAAAPDLWHWRGSRVCSLRLLFRE